MNFVLNLVISGIPSIPKLLFLWYKSKGFCFKPCYKWNTFNTVSYGYNLRPSRSVLNLVISGIPSILICNLIVAILYTSWVLNLVISGIPSILGITNITQQNKKLSFKPCYKWNTFNTKDLYKINLDIIDQGFKPCYKWNTFNTTLYSHTDFRIAIRFKPCYKWNTFNT